MNKPAMLTTLLETAALASAMLLAPGVACAQAGGANSGMSGQQQQQQPMSPNQQEMQNGIDNQQMNTMQAQAQDSMFVKYAMEGNMAEVQLGQLALQKSSNAQVRQFAQRMIDDHTKLNDDFEPIAQRLNVSVPVKLDKKDQKTKDNLSAFSGTQFDQAYMKDMVNDHKQDLENFKAEEGSTQNPTVKTVATEGAQVISAHLQMAEQIQSQQSASAGQ